MKQIARLPLLLLVFGPAVSAQQFPPQPAATGYAVATPATFNAQQLEQLLAPIALYPDPLLALMLPASTDYPAVVQAAQFLATGGAVNQVDLQPWDDSVRALAHYPQIVRWMAENTAWTQQLGEAFAAQPDNVMSAVQRLRARALAAGTLVNTPQQVIIMDGDLISIEPASPDTIYVPYYDPALVYQRPYAYEPGGYFTFSPAFETGWWLSFGLDWGGRRIWQVERGERERYWREHRRDWNRPPPQHPAPPRSQPWHPHNAPATRREGERNTAPARGASAPAERAHAAPAYEAPHGNGARPEERHGADSAPHSWSPSAAEHATTSAPHPASSPTRPLAAPTPLSQPVPARNAPPHPAAFAPPEAPANAWRTGHGTGTVTNDRFPTRPAAPEHVSPPTPSAALPGVSYIPQSHGAPGGSQHAPTPAGPARAAAPAPAPSHAPAPAPASAPARQPPPDSSGDSRADHRNDR